MLRSEAPLCGRPCRPVSPAGSPRRRCRARAGTGAGGNDIYFNTNACWLRAQASTTWSSFVWNLADLRAVWWIADHKHQRVGGLPTTNTIGADSFPSRGVTAGLRQRPSAVQPSWVPPSMTWGKPRTGTTRGRARRRARFEASPVPRRRRAFRHSSVMGALGCPTRRPEDERTEHEHRKSCRDQDAHGRPGIGEAAGVGAKALTGEDKPAS